MNKVIHYALYGYGKTACGIRYYTGHENWITYSTFEVTCKRCLKHKII